MARNTDIPFERDQSTRFLPWIVAVMVFLATLAAAAAIAVGDAIDEWDSSLTGRVTVQLAVGNDANFDGAELDNRAATIAQRLSNLPGVARAAVLPADEVRALLEPWLGTLAAADTVDEALPMPRLIDVELAPNGDVDAARLRETIADIAPNAVIDDHRVWLDALIDLARLVELVALLVLALIAVSAIAAVVFATRSGLAVHASIIELLHLMGAQDNYVARQFEAHAMWLGLRGGIIGCVAAVAVLATLGWVARDIDAAFLPSFAPSALHFGLIAAVPLATIVIAITTARLTVLRALARLP